MLNFRAFEFNVKVFIEKVTVSINFPCKLHVSLKRGKQKVESAPVDLVSGAAHFNQTLELKTNMYFENQAFQSKKAVLGVVIHTQSGNKVGGQVNLDISSYLNKNLFQVNEAFKLEKCPDKNAKLILKFQFSQLRELDLETLSRMSMLTGKNDDSGELQQGHSQSEAEDLAKQLQSEMLKVQQREQQISTLESELNAVKAQLVETLAEHRGLNEQFHEALDKLQTAEDEVESMKAQKHELQRQVSEAKQKAYDTQALFNEQSRRLDEVNKELRKADQKCSNLAEINEALGQKLRTLEEGQSQNKYVDDLKKEVFIYKQKVNEMEEKLKKEAQKYEQDMMMQQVKYRNLQQQLQTKEELLAKVVLPSAIAMSKPMMEADIENRQVLELQKQVLAQQQKEEQFNKQARESNDRVMQQYKDQISKLIASEKKQRQQIDQQLDQIVALKCQVGDMFNAAQELGGNELVDKLQYALGIKE